MAVVSSGAISSLNIQLEFSSSALSSIWAAPYLLAGFSSRYVIPLVPDSPIDQQPGIGELVMVNDQNLVRTHWGVVVAQNNIVGPPSPGNTNRAITVDWNTASVPQVGQVLRSSRGTGSMGLSEYYRGGSYVPDTPTNTGIAASGAIRYSQFYSAARVFSYTIGAESGNVLDLVIYTDAIGRGWNGVDLLQVTLDTAFYSGTPYGAAVRTGASTGVANNRFPGGLRIINSGHIMGRGGDAGRDTINGSTALQINDINVTVINTANGWITGGGGGGANGGGGGSPYKFGGGGGGGAGSTRTAGGRGGSVFYDNGTEEAGGLGQVPPTFFDRNNLSLAQLQQNYKGSDGTYITTQGEYSPGQPGASRRGAGGGGGSPWKYNGVTLPRNTVEMADTGPGGIGGYGPGSGGGVMENLITGFGFTGTWKSGGRGGAGANREGDNVIGAYEGLGWGPGGGGGGWGARGGFSTFYLAGNIGSVVTNQGGLAGRAIETTVGISYTLQNSGTIYGII